jgi:hypothetical protein
MSEFADKVAEITGWRSDPTEDRDSRKKWEDVEERLGGKEPCTGICLRWRVDEPCSIYLTGEFPRLGWSKLKLPNFGMRIV